MKGKYNAIKTHFFLQILYKNLKLLSKIYSNSNFNMAHGRLTQCLEWI